MNNRKTPAAAILHGYRIELSRDFRFRVVSPDFENCEFSSLEQAKSAVFEFVKQREKSKKSDLAVMNRDGQDLVITGINLHTGQLTVTPKQRRQLDRWIEFEAGVPNGFFPRSAKVKELIAESRRLHAELENNQQALERCCIKSYRGRTSVEDYAGRMAELVAEFERATKAALKL